MRKIFLWVIFATIFMTGCGNNISSYQSNNINLNEYQKEEKIDNAETEENIDNIKTEDYLKSENEKTEENGSIQTNIDVEILFRDIPWGSSYSEVNDILTELQMFNISGDAFKTMSIDDIVLGDYQGIQFEYNDINIVGACFNKEIEVAGYVTSDIQLYFVYIPQDGRLPKDEDNSAFYGAQYIFTPLDIQNMSQDLTEKLNLLYGEANKTKNSTDIWGNKYEYTYWHGKNNTELVMRVQDSSEETTGFYDDEIVLSYVWLDGDELLQNASDILKRQDTEKEGEIYGNGMTDGL